MNTFEFALELSQQRLLDADFGQKSLRQLETEANAQSMQAVNLDAKDPINFYSIGHYDAPNVILHATPMFTRLEDHFKLRLLAQQRALGADYRIVGVEGYVPDKGAFSSEDRKLMARGDLSPIAARILLASKYAGIRDEQKAYAYGYSLGADAAVQVTHNTLFNANRGDINILGVGALEPARVVDRNPAKLFLGDFNSSGKDLYKNVIESNVDALHEAFNIDRTNPDQKAFDKEIAKGVGKYIFKSLGLNLAIVRGLATDETMVQLDDILDETSLPVLLGHQKRSKVTPAAKVHDLNEAHLNRSNVHFLTESGDHSADDQIRKSATRIVYFSEVVKLAV